MSVEFLGRDESPEPPTSRHRRWTVPAVLAAAVVAGTIWALTRPTPSTPVAAPRPSATVHHRTAPRQPTACAGIPDCTVRRGVPASVRRVVQRYLAATRVRVQTVVAVNSLTLGDQLVRRDISATAGSVTVLIRVQRGGAAAHEIVHAPPGVGSLLLHRLASGYLVRVQYLAPETVPPAVARLRQLAGDPRLETL